MTPFQRQHVPVLRDLLIGRARLGAAASAASARFDIRRTVARLEAVYDSILEPGR